MQKRNIVLQKSKGFTDTVNTYHANLDKGNSRTVENNFASLPWKPIVELKHLKASTLPILLFSQNWLILCDMFLARSLR